MSTSIGVVGLGIMGAAYARNLMGKGFTVIGFDVDTTKLKALEAQGLKPATSPADVGRQCDLVVTSLPTPKAFHAVMSGPKGLTEVGRPIVVADTCTLALSDKEQAYEALTAAGVTLLDCPVSGTGAQAAKGDLVFFASGDKASYDRMRPALLAMGRVAHHLGVFGNGSRMKYVANLLVAIHNVSTAEAMAFGMKAGLNMEQVLEVIGKGAAQSWQMDNRGKTMVADKFDFGFAVDWMRKDLGLVMDEAKRNGARVPVTALVDQFYGDVQGLGGSRWDTSSLVKRLK